MSSFLLTACASIVTFEAFCCIVFVDDRLIITPAMMVISVLPSWLGQLLRYGPGLDIKEGNAASRLGEVSKEQAESEQLLESRDGNSQPDIKIPPPSPRNRIFMALSFFVLLSIISLRALAWSSRDSYSMMPSSITFQSSWQIFNSSLLLSGFTRCRRGGTCRGSWEWCLYKCWLDQGTYSSSLKTSKYYI